MPKKKPARKSAPKSKKKPARPKKRTLKKKILRKKKAIKGKKTSVNPATIEVFGVGLAGGAGNIFDDEDEETIEEEDFPQEYGGSE